MYTEDICRYWRFKNVPTATQSSNTIYEMFCHYRRQKDFIGMDMARKFIEMGFTWTRCYVDNKTGRKYSVFETIHSQKDDALTNDEHR